MDVDILSLLLLPLFLFDLQHLKDEHPPSLYPLKDGVFRVNSNTIDLNL